MKKLQNILIYLAFVGFAPLLTMAQSPKIVSYKMLKNKIDVEVTTIYQDQLGFMWIGTHDGLIKYDGVDFKLFNTQNGLSSNEVTCIIEDQKGVLWIGHKNGKISCLHQNQFSVFNPEEGQTERQISSFFLDNSGTVWYTTLDEGVYYFTGTNRKRLYNLNTDDGLLDNYVYSIAQDTSGNFYFATDKGISVYNLNEKKFVGKITTTDGLPDNLVKQLYYHNSHLWIGMEEGGVCVYEIGSKKIEFVSEWKFSSINNFIRLSDNEIWVSTARTGIIKCQFDETGKPWYSVYNKETGLSDNRANFIFLDREKNIWIGTKKGLSIRKNNNIEFLEFQSSIENKHKNIFSFTIDNSGKYWVAAQEGLYVYSRDEMGQLSQTQLLNETRFQGINFISLYNDLSGNIWAGTYGFGVFQINPTTYKYRNFNSSNGLTNDNIINITGDNNIIWLSSLGGGISKLDFSKPIVNIKSFTEENGMPSNYVYDILIDSKKQVWAATDGGGILKISNDSIQKIQNALLDSIAKKVYTIIEDSQQNIWINAAEMGIIKFDGKNYQRISETEGLNSNSVQSMSFNNQGDLVIFTDLGLQIFNTQRNIFESYGEEDGVSFLGPNLNSIYNDKGGNIWFGTSKCLVRLNAKSDKPTVNPQIMITGKSLFFNPITENITKFKHNQKHLTFQYTGLWYKSSSNLAYRYQLVGYDIDWSPETNSRTVTYSNLPAGSFRFQVQVKHPDGSWISSDLAEYAFVIKPPFWKTFWFISLMIISLIFGVYSFIKARTQKLIHDKEVLEEEVRKRTAEIWKQKEEIEAQRDEIEAQRNYVMDQRDQIEIQNKDIKASIQYASRIQKAVLTPLDSFNLLLGETLVFFKPRDIVSGDFYYLNVKNDKIIVAAADCTGHGVPGAFMSLMGISLLNQIVSLLPNNFNAAQILNELRAALKKSLRQTGKNDETKDGMDISLCVIERNNNQLNYSGAFNPLLLVRNKQLETFKADKMPIGVFIIDEVDFTNTIVETMPGDMLYLYSDGYQDQFGGEDKRKFLPKRLKELLVDISDLTMQQQYDQLDNTFTQWKADLSQIDDVLVMGIRIK
jgi:ligand-binding sensor domain-containing protein/serine phosphatase RsbU (regulator of sigma subunit)